MEQREINIEVKIAQRTLVVKALPDQEEKIYKAAELVNKKIEDLKAQYRTEDKQEYLAMALVSLSLQHIDNQEKMQEMEQRLTSLDQKLSLFFDESPGAA